MGILTKHQIIEHLKKGELIINPNKKENGEYDVEPASYDLRAGIFIWKETNRVTGETCTKNIHFIPSLPLIRQESVTLQPGQVMFVITLEEVKMPTHLCGTVYAKNSFSREGILALTTGHIDPGIQCPIVIRLINLRSIPITFQLGIQIYTIVFHTLEVKEGEQLASHEPISMEKTFSRTIESANTALGNTLYDLALTNDFVRKDEFGKLFWKMNKKSIFKIIAWIVGILVTVATIIGGWPVIKEFFNNV